MNDGLKREIKEAFDMVEPGGKKQFLKNFGYPKISRNDFIFEQIFYIRKKTWLFSVMIMGSILFFLYFYRNSSRINDSLWIISSLMPFFALIFMLELSRSSMFRMEEMEAGCLYGLSQIILARMLIMGIWNGLLLSVTIIAANLYVPEGIIEILIYLLAPFLFVSGLSLYLINNKKDRSEVYSCAAVSVFVSICGMAMQRLLKSCGGNIGIWVMSIALVIGFVLIFTQIRKMYKKLEEDQWNFA